MMPQFKALKNATINYTNIEKGIVIFSIGLFKKLIIADYFGGFADKGYSEVSILNFWGAWSTSLSYTIQLYYDFSGYCDMAIGAALLFNIKLPINFNSPYKAINIQDFWRRWHITLSTWLRDYIYIPLGGNRNGNLKTYRNIFITFVLGGVWHGAGWGFFIWGVLHGLGLMLHRVWQKYDIALPKFIAWLMTMLYVHITWVFFRADNLVDANIIIMKLFSLNDIIKTNFLQSLFENYHFIESVEGINGPYVAVLGLFLFVISATTKNSIELMQVSLIKKKRMAFVAALALSTGVLALLGNSSQTFLYFNF
jgi:alginate O-acetyltransferase complex protein AlgI